MASHHLLHLLMWVGPASCLSLPPKLPPIPQGIISQARTVCDRAKLDTFPTDCVIFTGGKCYLSVKEASQNVGKDGLIVIPQGAYLKETFQLNDSDRDSDVYLVGCMYKEIWCQDANIAFSFTLNVNLYVANVTVGGCWKHAIWAMTDGVSVEGSLFVSNGNTDIQGQEGSAVWASGTLTITSSGFNRNRGTLHGGSVHTEGSLSLTNSVFQENSAISGGAVFANDNLWAFNSTFEKNTAKAWRSDDIIDSIDPYYQKGGGVSTQGELHVEECVFRENGAGTHGGAVYTGYTSAISSSRFIANSAGQTGGGVRGTSKMSINGCFFEQNRASYGGGLSGSDMTTIENSRFAYNRAENHGGGAKFNTGQVTGCEFVRNEALAGGGFHSNGIVRISSSKFIGNLASDRSGGGGIYNFAQGSMSVVTIEESKFEGNYGGQGGGVWAGAGVSVSKSAFTKNTAKLLGGGVYSEGNITLTLSTLSANYARAAGAVYAEDNITSISSTFLSNGILFSTTGTQISNMGGAIQSSKWAVLFNSRFDSNIALIFGGAVVGESGVEIFGSVVRNNSVLDTVQGKGGGVAATGPVFAKTSEFLLNQAARGAGICSEKTVTVNSCVFRENTAQYGGGFYSTVGADVSAGNNVFKCNRVQSGGAFYVLGYGLDVPDEESPNQNVYRNNLWKAGGCPSYAIGRGSICSEVAEPKSMCECDWPNGQNTCGTPGAVCVTDQSNVGFHCECVSPDQWTNGTGPCRKCSECAPAGQITAPCQKLNDTQCRCPEGKTGNRCEISCSLPPHCLRGDSRKCLFDATNPSKGVVCEKCQPGFYIDMKFGGVCTACSTCGETGKVSQPCTAENDTVCICPLGKTGNNCSMDCSVPPGCGSLVLSTLQQCQFDGRQTDKGVVCTACLKEYYIVQGGCVPVTTCPTEFFEKDPPTSTADRTCQPCTPPSRCAKVRTYCQPLQDTICDSCPIGWRGAQCTNQGLAPKDIAAVAFGAAGFVVGVAMCFGLYFRRRGRRKRKRQMRELVARIGRSYHWTDAGTEEAKCALDEIRQLGGPIPRSQFAILEQLGRGAFGSVWKGVVYVGGSAVVCAIKTTHTSDSTVRDEFMRECDMIKRLDHPNIVRVIGMCAATGGEEGEDAEEISYEEEGGVERLYLLLEYMEMGDLLRYVRNNQECSVACRVWFGLEVARALVYLASMGIIHRDIACRNILLCGSRPGSFGFPTAKISDLGLARIAQGEGGSYVRVSTRKQLLPVRWMAPESILDGIFNEKTDVWAYAVAMWEVFSNGDIPYEFLQTPNQILQAVKHNVRLLKPPLCPDVFCQLLLACWSYQPEGRPHFVDILAQIDNIFGGFELPLGPGESVSPKRRDSAPKTGYVALDAHRMVAIRSRSGGNFPSYPGAGPSNPPDYNVVTERYPPNGA